MRPAFCLRMKIGKNGEIVAFEPEIARARLAANLLYEDVQAVLEGSESPDNPAFKYREQLFAAREMANARENYRVDQGAIIIRKTESKVTLEERDGDIIVRLEPESPNYDASRIVGELMVAASAEFARWATEHDLPLIYRTQNVTVPREYAGVWEKPEDMARIMRSLAHSILETSPRPHAALGLPCYAPVTSPIRRYADLVNEAQAMHFIAKGSPRWTEEELEKLLDSFSPDLEAASQVQRFRPRYWKLLYLKQLGEKEWIPAVITEENDNFVSVSALDGALFLRGRRGLFDERAVPGMNVMIRAGKVNPLYNESQILEVLPIE
ncbi:MAG: RNB domain-containing ribonuclease [Desulfovibrio sp.]|nr:RNB domain-containing ribonuclease [Desulfovibrio sp.]